MSILMGDLLYVLIYLDDLLVVTNGTLADHLVKLTEVLWRLSAAGQRVNTEKYNLRYGGRLPRIHYNP